MTKENKHGADQNATESLFLNVGESLSRGWAQTVYAVSANCVSCPVCETLIANVSADGSTHCHGCGWMPGEYPANEMERAELRAIIVRRFGKRDPNPPRVGLVRRFVLGIEKAVEGELRLVLHERILEHMRVFSVGGYYGDTLEQ